MSPKVGMELSLRSWARALRTPPGKVFASLMRMRAQGIPLRYGEAGVTLKAEGWRLTSTDGVSLLGAVVLSFPEDPKPESPPQYPGEPGEHVARVLEVVNAYVCGLDEGWHREAHLSSRIHDIHREAYLCGYEVGMEARFRATLLCELCGARRFRSEPACPRCAGST